MPEKNKKPDGFDVGYGKPPRHTRFQPGKSGNPCGRPKGTRNLKTDISDELADRIVITEAGQRRKISKQQAMVKSLVARAIKGDVRAASTLIGLIERLVDVHGDDTAVAVTADDEALLNDFLQRCGASEQKAGGDGAVSPVRPAAKSTAHNTKTKADK